MTGHLGLVCMTDSSECRFRTITLSAYQSLKPAARREKLREIYFDNLTRLHRTLSFCHRNRIHLYRMPSSLFPMSDRADGRGVLLEMKALLSSVGRRVERIGVRALIHPDQFVVLNSESPRVAKNSRLILNKHALWLDLMGLPQTPWTAMIIHGGKSGRAAELIATIQALPANVKNRLCLENDEYSYSAAEILDVCRATGVPMIFDNLHHVVHAKLDTYSDASVQHFVREAAKTWPDPGLQIVHLSNGNASFSDRTHGRLIVDIPDAYRSVPWVEVEAVGKECAIRDLREKLGSF